MYSQCAAASLVGDFVFMSLSDEEDATAMEEQIQSAVRAEVEAALARLNPPASSSASIAPSAMAPSSSAVTHSGKSLHVCLFYQCSVAS